MYIFSKGWTGVSLNELHINTCTDNYWVDFISIDWRNDTVNGIVWLKQCTANQVILATKKLSCFIKKIILIQ